MIGCRFCWCALLGDDGYYVCSIFFTMLALCISAVACVALLFQNKFALPRFCDSSSGFVFDE